MVLTTDVFVLDAEDYQRIRFASRDSLNLKTTARRKYATAPGPRMVVEIEETRATGRY
jgi:hypothetical protein